MLNISSLSWELIGNDVSSLFPIIDESIKLNGVVYLIFNTLLANSPNAIKAGNFANTLYRIGVGIKYID